MPRVLVIDDNEDFRSLLSIALEAEGFEVETAPDGLNAAEVLHSRPASVVVTDIFMPGKEGIETISDLRKQFPGVHIIAMSGRASATDFDPLVIAQELGAARTLRKPFSIDELIGAVRSLTGK